MARISLNVNGKARVLDVDAATPLLYILRNDLALNGPRFGCGLAQCSACTVIMDGKAVRSCSVPVNNAQNRNITTLEGLGITAAIANAIFDAVGAKLREVPFTPERVLSAMDTLLPSGFGGLRRSGVRSLRPS